MAAKSFTLFNQLPGEIQKRIWLFAEADAIQLAEQQLDLLYEESKESKERDGFIYNLSIRPCPDGLHNGFLNVIERKYPIIKNCLATFRRGTITATIDIFPAIDWVETDEMSESEVASYMIPTAGSLTSSTMLWGGLRRGRRDSKLREASRRRPLRS